MITHFRLNQPNMCAPPAGCLWKSTCWCFITISPMNITQNRTNPGPICNPWCWNIYQHLPHKWASFVGKYASTMEQQTQETSPKIHPRSAVQGRHCKWWRAVPPWPKPCPPKAAGPRSSAAPFRRHWWLRLAKKIGKNATQRDNVGFIAIYDDLWFISDLWIFLVSYGWWFMLSYGYLAI